MLLLAALAAAAALVVDSSWALDAATLGGAYDGIKVLRVPTGNASSVVQLDSLISELGYVRWTTVSRENSYIDVQVPSADVESFTSAANSANTDQELSGELTILHDDLGASIREEEAGIGDGLVTALADQSWFNSYHSFNDHIAFLSELNDAFPDNTELFSSGTSFQGRDLAGIHIFGVDGPGSKPAVIFHGTVHAREWITTLVNEYIVYSLLTNYANNTEVRGYVDNFDFYNIPVVNPDGFTYSQTTERLWRKNRQTAPPGSTCIGIDINRNWAHSAWSSAGGASTNPCSETYKGRAPADAPETRQLAAFIDNLASSNAGALLYIDWHSYSQLFLTPYGYTCTGTTPDAAEYRRVGSGFVSSVASVHGTQYTHGPACTTIYQTTGSSIDYVYDNSDVRYSVSVELRDRGQNGFVLPASQIRPLDQHSGQVMR